MIPYNTDLKPITLPEFGRNVQGMVDYCVSIPDREERTKCAFAIADIMANLFPGLVGEGRIQNPKKYHILHPQCVIAIMARASKR